MDEGARWTGIGRFVLRALAIGGALAFLALVMLQAREFYAPPTKPPTTQQVLPDPATKAAPVVHPSPRVEPTNASPAGYPALLPGTKAGFVDLPSLGVKY